MNTEEIIEGNKLIDEFLGNKITFWNKRWFVNNYLVMNYHYSWESLMFVIDKIEKLGYGTIISYYSMISNYGCQSCEIDITHNVLSGFLVDFDDCGNEIYGQAKFMSLTRSKKESTYKAIVQFIKWYNQNKEYNGN